MSVLMTLLRKDWRVVKPAVLVGLGMYATPYLVLGYQWLAGAFHVNKFYMQQDADQAIFEAVQAAALIAACLWCVVWAALAGMTFARERRDRSAEFMELLPVSRGLRVSVKYVLTLVIAAVPVCATLVVWNLAGRELLHLLAMRGLKIEYVLHGDVIVLLSISAMAFGVALLASALVRSEVVATCIGLGSAMLLFVTLWQKVVSNGVFVDAYGNGTATMRFFDVQTRVFWVFLVIAIVTVIAAPIVAWRRRTV